MELDRAWLAARLAVHVDMLAGVFYAVLWKVIHRLALSFYSIYLICGTTWKRFVSDSVTSRMTIRLALPLIFKQFFVSAGIVIHTFYRDKINT